MERTLSFDEFQALLAGALGLEVTRLAPEAHFLRDLGVDSLRMVEVLLKLEQQGLAVSPDVVWQVQTVGDAYQLYTHGGEG